MYGNSRLKTILATAVAIVLLASLVMPAVGNLGLETVDEAIEGYTLISPDEEANAIAGETRIDVLADDEDNDHPTAGEDDGDEIFLDDPDDVETFDWDATHGTLGWQPDEPDQGEDVYFISEALEGQTDDGYIWATYRVPDTATVADPAGDMFGQYEPINCSAEVDTGEDYIEIEVEKPAFTVAGADEPQEDGGTYDLFENYAVFVDGEYEGITEFKEDGPDDPVEPDFMDPTAVDLEDITTGWHEFTIDGLDAGESYDIEVRPQFDFGDHFTGHYDEEEMDDYYTTQRAGPSVTVETDDDVVEVDEIVIEEDVTETAGVEGDITVTAYDEDEEPVEGEEISIDDDDDLGGIEEGETEDTDEEGEASFTFEEETAEEYEVLFSAEDEDITDTGTVTIEPADTVEVSIDPDEDQTVATGETIDFEAEAEDEFENIVEDQDEEFDWDAEDGYIDDSGVFEEEETGDYDVTASYDDETSEPTTVSVEETEIDEVLIDPEGDQTVEAGEELTFEAEAYDEDGELVQDDPEEFEWENALNGVFYEEDVGEYDVVATYDVSSEPTTVTVEPAELDYINVEPEEETITAGDSVEYTATSYDEFHNEIEDVTGETDWSDDVEVSEWDDNELTASTAGDWTVTGEYEDLEDTVDLEVEVGETDEVVIDPDEDQTVDADEQLVFDASAYDEHENLVEEEEDKFDWENAPSGVFREQEVGDYEVTATYEGEESDVTVVTVEPAEVDYVEIDPDEDQTVEAGEELEFTAEAYDEWDNEITDDVTEFDWENIDEIDEEDNVAVFYEEDPEEYDVTADYEGETSPTTVVTVEPGDPDYIEIEPEEEEIAIGEGVEYTSTAFDEYDNEIDEVTDETDWSDDVEPEDASEWVENEITVEEAGDWTITGEYDPEDVDPITETADLTVLDTEVDEVIIETDDPLEIEAGETIDFYAEAFDGEGELVEDDDEEFTWFAEEDGDITGEGVFEDTTAGEYEVSARYEGVYSDETTVTVEPAPVDQVNIDPEEDVTITTGEKHVFSAEALDEYDNLITESSTDFDWAESTRGVFYQTTPGDYDVTATYEGETSEATTVTVEPDEADYLVIEPEESTIDAGETETYTATAYDENQYEIGDVTDDVDWDDDIDDASWEENDITAYTAGEWTVTAEYEDATGEAELTVEPADADEIDIWIEDDEGEDEITIEPGEKVFFEVEAVDEYGNEITDSTTGVDWEDPVVRGVFDETEEGEYDIHAELDGVESNVITVNVEEDGTESDDTLTEGEGMTEKSVIDISDE